MNLRILTTSLASLAFALAAPAFAASPTVSANEPTAGDDDQATELARQLSNPVASLISVPFQANEDFHMGPTNKGYQFKLNFQPVVPISISQDWNLIVRTIVPYVSQHDVFYREIPRFPGLPNRVLNEIPPALRADAEKLAEKVYNQEVKKHPQNRSQDGLGDTTQSFFLSPKALGPGGLIWGLGPVVYYPTATNDLLGSGQWGLGPTLVALKQTGGWTYGVLANQIWSLEHHDDRQDINSLFLQPFVTYTTKTHTTFALNAESTYDWNDSQWTVPVNLSVAQILKIGKQPVQIQLGGRYYADGPSGAPDWGVRLTFTLLYPQGKHEPAPPEGKAYAK